MNRIQKVSSYLLYIVNALVIIFPLFQIVGWISETSHIGLYTSHIGWQTLVNTPTGYINLNTVNWTPLTQFTGLISEIIKSSPLFISFFTIRKIFINYCKNEIFNTINPQYYRRLGWLLFINAILAKPLSQALMTLAVSLNNAPKHHYISINFGTPNLAEIFCGTIIIVISWIMLEASQLHQEQQLTV